MAKKIFWTFEEQNAIYQELVRLFVQDPLLRKDEAMRAAQKVLPKERHRTLYGSTLYRFLDIIAKARDEAKELAAAPPAPEPEPEPAPPPAEDPLWLVVDKVCERLVDKLWAKIEQRIEFSPAPHSTTVKLKHDPTPLAQERAVKQGVLIIGLLNQQAETIIKQFPTLEMTCLTSDEALKREPLRRTHTILMTKFISHSVQEKYRKATNLRLCNGGVSELSTLLKSIS